MSLLTSPCSRPDHSRLLSTYESSLHRHPSLNLEVCSVNKRIARHREIDLYVPVDSPVVLRLKIYPPVLASVASKRKSLSGFEFPAFSTAPEAEVEIWLMLMAWTVMPEEDNAHEMCSSTFHGKAARTVLCGAISDGRPYRNTYACRCVECQRATTDRTTWDQRSSADSRAEH